jgi:hypothetical protein
MEKHMWLIKNKILLVVAAALLVSCSVAGVYTYSGYNTELILSLNSDHSFTYDIHVNHSHDTIYGKWIYKQDSLFLDVLNSDVIFDGDINYNVYEGVYGSFDSLYFNVHVTNFDAILVALAFNGDGRNPEYISSNNDTIAYSRKDLKEFEVSSFLGGRLIYKPIEKSSNFFRVEFASLDLAGEITVMRNPDTLFIKKGRCLIVENQPEIKLKK